MPETTATLEHRDAQIDRYVALDALETLIRTISFFAPFDALAMVDRNELTLGGTVDLFCDLWPDEPEQDEPNHGPLNPDSVEALLAGARSNAITARILTLLATDDGRDWMLDEAIKLSGRAGEATASATTMLAIERTASENA